jgi:ribosomal protein S27AE
VSRELNWYIVDRGGWSTDGRRCATCGVLAHRSLGAALRCRDRAAARRPWEPTPRVVLYGTRADINVDADIE